MEMSSMPPGFSLKGYLDELGNLRDKLQQVLHQHQLLLSEHRLLKQRVDELTDNPDSLNDSPRTEEGRLILESMISVLSEVGRPMLAKEIGEMLKSRNVIPIQILNVKAYVIRRLEVACTSDAIRTYHHDGQGKKYFYLPEWADLPGGIQQLFYKGNMPWG
jgi:hypothetical protein